MDVKRFLRGSAAFGAAAFFGVAAVVLLAATPLNDIPGTTEMYSAAETDARIAELGGAGDYATVSNAAVNAGWRATNYTDYAVLRLSQTNSVLSGGPYVTPSGMEDYVTNALSGIKADRITDGTNTIDAARNVYATSHNWQFTGQRDDDEISLSYGSATWTMTVFSDSLGTDMSSIVTNENVTRLVFNFPYGERAYSITAVRDVPTYVGRLALTNDIPTVTSPDFTTNNAQLVATIEAKAPAPGNYTAVSNAAMNAIQSLEDATNYTDAVAQEFEDGTRMVQQANFASEATTASEAYYLGGFMASEFFNESTNAAIAVADAKISTNNEAFVSAVLAVPIAGADAGDLAEIAEYGSYGTVGAAILALIAGLAALKRRVTSAETALAQKADASDLPYRLVEPGVWEFSGVPEGVTDVSLSWNGTTWNYTCVIGTDTYGGLILRPITEPPFDGNELSLTFSIESSTVTATRASLTGHLLDRAGNRVVVTGDTTLTLPAAVPGYLRDFLVRLEISGSTVPTITFAAPTGETLTYETDGDDFPVPDEAGDWLYSFTESCVSHKFAVSLKKVNTVAQGGS